jgi:plastocyanin
LSWQECQFQIRSERIPMRFAQLAFALVVSATLVAGCSSSSPSATPTTPTPNPTPTAGPTPVTISMPRGATQLTTTAYVPSPATVPVGTTVTWVNNDIDPHTSTSTTNVWTSGTLQPGASFSRTFSSQGTFPYVCLIHPNMVGTIVVQ